MKKFLPLIGIFLVILIITAIAYGVRGGDVVFTMRVFMGSFFVVFGLFKLPKIKHFVMAYREYDLLAMRSGVYAYSYPFIELVLGIGYFANWQPVFVNSVTLVVMTVSALGVLRALMRRQKIVCACLGTVFKIPMTWVTLTEDVVMAVMAAIMLILL